MAQQTINIGAAPNDGTGDPLRTAYTKTNDNFTELYGGLWHPGFVTGRWYPCMPGALANGTNSIGTGTIRAIPVIVPRPVTLSGIFGRCTTGIALANVQFGIYAGDVATCLPTGNALAYTASKAATAAGIVSELFTTAGGSGANVALVPGLYFFCINGDTAGTQWMSYTGLSSTTAYLRGSLTDTNVSNSATESRLFLSATQTYGTWPSATGLSWSETVGATHAFLWMKVA